MGHQSKQDFALALKSLLANESFDKITVSKVCAKAGYNRQTFYYHFANLNDLLEFQLRAEADALLAGLLNYDSWEKGFLVLLTTIQREKVSVANFFYSSGMSLGMLNVLYDFVNGLLTVVLKDKCRRMGIPSDAKRIEAIAGFYRYPLADVTVRWFATGLKESPKAVVDYVSRMMAGSFERLLEN